MAWADLNKYLRSRSRIWNYINQLIDNTEWLKDNGGGGSGDMLQSMYDSDEDGVVDAAESLRGNTTGDYVTAEEVVQAVDDINDLLNGANVQGSYKTGWVYETDFSAVEFSYTHNLNSNLSDLIVKIFMSPDGTDENALEVGFGLRYVDASAQSAGLTVYQVSANEIKIETATAGIVVVNESNGVTLIASNYYIKVAIYKMGDVLVSTPTLGIYDTGWVANSDWTYQLLGSTLGNNLDHNLDCNLSDLIIKIVISTDGTDANSFEVAWHTHSYDQASPSTLSNQYGISVFQVDTNTLSVITGDHGIKYVDPSDGSGVNLDTESYYYKIKVYKLGNISITPAEAFEVKNVSADYTLTSADNGVRELRVTPSTADITITLPYRSIRYGIDLKVINCGDGTYSVNVVTQGAETINGTPSVEITEANGWWKFCPGNATSTEWKTETDGYSTIYRSESSATDTGLSVNNTWDDDGNVSLNLSGIFGFGYLSARATEYIEDTSTVLYISSYFGLGETSGNNSPDIDGAYDEWNYVEGGGDYLSSYRFNRRVVNCPYESDGTATIYMKAKALTEELPLTAHHLAGGQNGKYIEWRRIR